MPWLIIWFAVILSSCATIKTPEDYTAQRQAEDSIDWEYESKNNLLDSPDGSVYYNRNMNLIGVEY